MLCAIRDNGSLPPQADLLSHYVTSAGPTSARVSQPELARLPWKPPLGLAGRSFPVWAAQSCVEFPRFEGTPSPLRIGPVRARCVSGFTGRVVTLAG